MIQRAALLVFVLALLHPTAPSQAAGSLRQDSCVPAMCIWAQAVTGSAELAITPKAFRVYDRASCDVLAELALPALSLTDPIMEGVLPQLLTYRVPRLALSPDGRYAAVAAQGLHLFDTFTWHEMAIPALETTSSQAFYLLWSPSGRYLTYEDDYQLYALDLETQTIQLIASNLLDNVADIPYEIHTVSFTPDEQWIEIKWNQWESGLHLVVNLSSGETLWTGEEGYGHGCSTLRWRGDAEAFAVLCSAYPSDPQYTLDVCFLAERRCVHHDLEAQFAPVGWTAAGQFVFSSETENAAGSAVTTCSLLSADGLRWTPTRCDTPVEPSEPDVPVFHPEKKSDVSPECADLIEPPGGGLTPAG